MFQNIPAFKLTVIAALIAGFFVTNSAYAQLPDCNSGNIYYISGTNIYIYDPSQPMGPGNPSINTIIPPAGSGGLAINDNINGPGPSPTFYVVGNNNIYQYWDGTSWVNTGHNAGAINPGGAGPYIFSLEGSSGQVYKYDGTGNATLLMTLPGFNGGGPYDLVGGCNGHFFALKTTTPQWMNEYDANGNLVNTWTLTGAPVASSGGGFSIIGDKVYYTNNGPLNVGTINGNNIDVVVGPASLNPGPSDFGTCPSYVGGIYASIDTGYYCDSAVNVPVTVDGNGPFTWAVLNGPAVITGSGAAITVSTTSFSQIAVTGTGGGCGTGTDTVTLIIPKATVDAGPKDTIYAGCQTTLHGTLTNTTPGLTYTINWTPTASIVTGGNTLTPVVDPTVSTTYTMTVTTDASHGGCSWTDTVRVTVLQASSIQASIDTGYYCGSGPGVPVSVTGTAPYTWSVLSGPGVITGSGSSITVTSTATTRIRVANPALCGNNADTVTIVVPTGTLDAGLADTIFTGCGTTTDTLNATLTNTLAWLTYNISWTPAGWVAANGNTTHPIVNPPSGTTFYINVSTDANHGGCQWKDSVDIAVVNMPAHADFTKDLRLGCTGDTVVFTNNSTGYSFVKWDFGDSTATSNTISPVHIYQHQGLHIIKLVVTNGHCADSMTTTINVNHSVTADFSYAVDLDSICQGAAIVLVNGSSAVNDNNIPPTYEWIFGDGDTTSEANPTHLYLNSGVYHLALVATDIIPCHDTMFKTIEIDSLVYNSSIYVKDTEICLGQPLDFAGDYSPYTLKAVHWDMGDGHLYENTNLVKQVYDVPGTYTVTLIADYRVCPDDTVTRTIKVYPYPNVYLGPDTAICPNAGSLVLKDALNENHPAASWLWNTGAKTSHITVSAPGTYVTTVTENNCSASDTIEVLKNCYIDIPNTFTPNGDGVNDYFFPRNLLSKGLTSFKLNIFNRWGELIYETHALDGRGWDGKYNDVPQPEGVFIYVIEASFTDGRTEKYQGNLTLLR